MDTNEVEYALDLGAAQVVMARSILKAETNSQRRPKMQKVVELLQSDLAAADERNPDDILAGFAKGLGDDERLAFLVEVHFLDAFQPYDLRYGTRRHKRAMTEVALAIGETEDIVDRIMSAVSSATASHKGKTWKRAGLIGVAAAVVVGVGGFVAAPAIGAALGGAAGLSGAAATAHGLALLGGGALAAGGSGIAGGMWLVTGIGGVAGAVAGGGGATLFELGAAQARAELIKLQATFKVSVLGRQADLAKAKAMMDTLEAQLEDLKKRLEVERLMNDENSHRIKDLEQVISAIEEAVDWMEGETGDPA